MFKNILIVCVGNICRSPIGEYLLATDPRAVLADAKILSAGLSAMVGQPADPSSVEIMRSKGIDLSPHRARQLDSKLVLQADLILVMETWQQKEIEKAHPTARGKVHGIGKWQGFEVPDPYRKDLGAFEQSYQLIECGLADWKDKIWKR